MTIQKTLTIVNKLGLHARAATQLVKLANQFDAKIILKKGDKEAMKELVEANLRFVVSVAKKYQGNGLSLSETLT